MRKIFLYIFLFLGISFLGITYFKVLPSAEVKTEQRTTGQDSNRTEVNNFWKYYNLATDYRTDGNYQKASEYYRRALAIDSTHSNTLYYMGNMHLILGNYQKAADSWNSLIELNIASARGHVQLGTLYSCQDSLNFLYNPKRAAVHFMKAAELNPEVTDPLLQMAKFDLMNKQFESASRRLDDVMSTNFRSVEAHFLQGYLAWKKESLHGAEKYFDLAKKIKMGNDDKYNNAGEGATDSDNELIEMNFNQCNTFSDLIDSIIDVGMAENSFKFQMDDVYQEFDSKVIEQH